MKTLVTKRLILRELKFTDLIGLFTYARKPNIGPSAGWKPHDTIEETAAILRMLINEGEVWAVTLKEKDEIIGTIGLHVRNFENALANQKEIGYVLDDTYWGRGLMPEAVSAVLDYAFREVELDRVLCGHVINNFQSKRVIEKTGFHPTHQEKRDHYDHTKVEIQMYELTKVEYLKGER
ncbi:MAG: GNAT family N-acetyltransferase [Acholeplasmataceae bacterium]|nr:GNAT family N-acetyltransferase [Acholeplasmataceae bacterium]